MNIFALHENPIVAARWHTDKHVVKMILETAQLLSTAHRILDVNMLSQTKDAMLYKKTHWNHPCAVWVRESTSNYYYAYRLLVALLEEFEYRYGKEHKTKTLLPYLKDAPLNIRFIGLTPFAQAMDNRFKDPDGVTAYRKYYNDGKSHLHTWTGRPIPPFIRKEETYDTPTQEPQRANI
jgi:hypothetical protein